MTTHWSGLHHHGPEGLGMWARANGYLVACCMHADTPIMSQGITGPNSSFSATGWLCEVTIVTEAKNDCRVSIAASGSPTTVSHFMAIIGRHKLPTTQAHAEWRESLRHVPRLGIVESIHASVAGCTTCLRCATRCGLCSARAVTFA